MPSSSKSAIKQLQLDGVNIGSAGVSPLKVTANTAMPLFLLMLFFAETTPIHEENTTLTPHVPYESPSLEEEGEDGKSRRCRSNICAVVRSVPQMKLSVLKFQTNGVGEDLLFTLAITNTDPELNFPGGYLHISEEDSPDPASSSSSLTSSSSYIGTPAPFKVPAVAPLHVVPLRVKIHCMYNKHYQPPKKEMDITANSWMPQHEDSNARALARIPRGVIFSLATFEGEDVGFEPYHFLFGAFVATEMARYRVAAESNYRFVLAGMRGSSKSEFVNSVNHLILRSDEDGHVMHLAHTGSGDDHLNPTTLSVNEYPMPNGIPFTLIDTPGMTLYNYQDDQMEDILKGNYCPNRWDLSREGRGFKDNWVRKKADAALFFIPHDLVGDPAVTPVLLNFSSLANRLGVPFVIVISKADTLDYTLARNALAPSEDLKTAYLTVKAQAMVNWQSITHLISYHSDNSRSDFNIDRQTYIVYKKLLNLILIDTSHSDLMIEQFNTHLIAILSFFTYLPFNPTRALRDLIYNEDISVVVVSILLGCASFSAGWKLWLWFSKGSRAKQD